MPAYLLTWNPGRWPWDDVDRCRQNVKRKGRHRDTWGCGSTRRICPGDRLFLIRLGKEPRGIVASGHAISKPSPGPHWDKTWRARGKTAWYVEVEFDAILDPGRPFPRARLDDAAYAGMHWEPHASGVTIPDDIAAQLEVDWAAYVDPPVPSTCEHRENGWSPASATTKSRPKKASAWRKTRART